MLNLLLMSELRVSEVRIRRLVDFRAGTDLVVIAGDCNVLRLV